VVHYFPSLVLPYRPRTIVVYAGENDIADGRPAEMLAKDVDALLALRRKHLPKSKLVFISLKPSPSRAEKLEEVRKANTLIRQRLAGQKKAVFVDVFTPMLDAGGKAREELSTRPAPHERQRLRLMDAGAGALFIGVCLLSHIYHLTSLFI
jgi:lysophospholipase L1-like esterase